MGEMVGLLGLVVLIIPVVLARRGIGSRGRWAAGGITCLLLSLLGCFLAYVSEDADARLRSKEQLTVLLAREQAVARAIGQDSRAIESQVGEAAKLTETRIESSKRELVKIRAEIYQAQTTAAAPNAEDFPIAFMAAMFWASMGCLIAAAVSKPTPP